MMMVIYHQNLEGSGWPQFDLGLSTVWPPALAVRVYTDSDVTWTGEEMTYLHW